MIRASANDLKLDYSRWEHVTWNDFETLEWWVILLNDFEGEYDLEKMVIFDKNWCWFECDTFPIIKYPHNTWLWVGLNWKFMHLSMGSL